MTATTYGTGSGYQKPTNAILVAGTPLVQFMKVEDATTMYPGRLVLKGTGDDDAKVNTGVGLAIGWLGYEQTLKANRPADVNTLYTIGLQASVLAGPIVIVASAPAGQTIVKGNRLAPTSAGQVILATSETDIVGVAEESVTTGSYDADIMVRSLI